jgi:hypothetical protein
MPMSLPALVYLIYNYGIWGGCCFLLSLLLLTLFTIFFINALYIVILKITTPQRFQSIISYVQVIFAITIYASYQIIPRMMGKFENMNLDITSKPFIIYFPLYWFAGGWNFLYRFQGSLQESAAFVLSIIVPLVSVWVVIKYLAPSFNNKLSMINSVAAESTEKATITYQKSRRGYVHFLSNLFTKKGPERMGFLFTWKMTTRSRDFRLKVYPGIGYILVYVVIILLSNKKFNLNEIKDQTGAGKFIVLSAVYFCSYLLIIAISQIVYSEKYKAAWIYFIAPVAHPGKVISGSIKAAILKFYIPVVVFIITAGIILVGFGILPNVILGLFNELLITSILVYVNKRYLPFSLHQNNNIKSGSFLRGLFVMFCSGIIAVLHYLVYNITPVIIIFCVLSIIATWLMMQSIENTTWSKVRGAELLDN